MTIMKLNISDWESFCASDIFFLYNGSGITKEEIEDNPGSFPAVQSGADNNGCIGYISKDYCKAMNYTYVEEPCLTVARTGSAGFVAFQPYGCVVGDSAKILLLKKTYAPMITGRTPIPNGKQTSYERNRNLFYVCCSRPRKRLFFFVSVPIDASFRVFLDDLVGAENIYTYGQYLEAKQ